MWAVTYLEVNSHGPSCLLLFLDTSAINTKLPKAVNTAEGSHWYGGGLLGGYLPRAPPPRLIPFIAFARGCLFTCYNDPCKKQTEYILVSNQVSPELFQPVILPGKQVAAPKRALMTQMEETRNFCLAVGPSSRVRTALDEEDVAPPPLPATPSF